MNSRLSSTIVMGSNNILCFIVIFKTKSLHPEVFTGTLLLPGGVSLGARLPGFVSDPLSLDPSVSLFLHLQWES